jgi:superfamily II DNA or RNA helicase
MVESPDTKWLIEQGYLSPFKYVAPESDLDVSGVPITASGDLNTKELRKRVVESHLVGNVVEHYLKRSAGKRAIVFATDVETANDMADAFNLAGVKAVALSGETDATVRDRELAGFEDGSGVSVLINVDLFDEGFDVPAVEVVILARPTESLAKFLQMVGRGLRVVYAKGFDLTTQAGRLAAIAAGTKSHALIIDPVRNWERHGMPNWPRVWSLEGRATCGRGEGSDTVPQRVCIGCTQPYEAYYTCCPHCGAVPEPAGRYTPEEVEGDLLELDVEGMAALFEKLNKADMSDEEYTLDQFNRNIPAIGRSADLKRHQAAKYRRKVLNELVAWWIGIQPAGRSLNEKHRRFYHRFGVDIGTAFTLNAADTDALMERIQQRFTEDLAA